MNWLLDQWGRLAWFLDVGWALVVNEAREHPTRVAFALYVFARLLGKTISTGERGVRFRFGRVRGALEPGFHWQVPGLEKIRVVPARSQTLDLQGQRLSTPRGLVFLLDANLVYRIDDPIKALVEIDDYHEGCLTALALAVQEVIWRHGDTGLSDLELFGAELTRTLAPRLEPWGIAIEEAGFTTLAPSAQTLRFTQLGLRLDERRRVVEHLMDAGLPRALALGLLGSTRQLKERASVRYRHAPLRHPRRPRRSQPKPWWSEEPAA